MKPFIEKLPRSQNSSFVARTYCTPHFEVPWHQHTEYELILITRGEGTAFIGNYVGSFSSGDIFFLGSNLPHTFRKSSEDLITSAVVIQFTDDFWGKDFLSIPEAESLRELLELSSKGLRIEGRCRSDLQQWIPQVEEEQGFARFIRLCQCLQLMAESRSFQPVSTQESRQYSHRQRDRIEKIFQHSITHFQEAISLSEISRMADMSIPAFCSYFKKCTKKTYIDFLNEIRIGHACKLLADSRQSVLEICYDSGFNTVANFNKQFRKLKGMSPGSYRKKYNNPHLESIYALPDPELLMSAPR
ncbi:MAG TPA: AraC family transcriptional regulator, partial [Chitinophagaceae bacterium]|jgi:AraC-like DNA-binding protein/quercetin dioxygenase-like cupin family protein|nr:AraC family transcriptional regulator [Chitinophagaceae bacterium]